MLRVGTPLIDSRSICRAAVILLMLLSFGPTRLLHATPPQYTIGQLYSAAKRAPEMKGAKSFTENALIITPSYRVSKEMLNRYYFHPEHGRQIKELLEKDTFVSWWQIDNFVRRNIGRIHHVSLYEEGFVLVQMDNPQNVLILPVSLVTVRKSEQIVKAYLQLQ
ncbi:MAG: hypothetical protein FIB02_07650 [Desulfuromonas sp.]|nr:hypothetical protein [Desulfuromonas sp.]